MAVALTSINQPVFSPGVPNLGAALKTLTAKAGSTTCTTETLAGATSDVILHIGAPGQPDACSVEGATVTFVDGNGLTLHVSYTLRKGTRDTLINLAPLPPHEPDNSGPIDGATSGEFQVVILASLLQLAIPIDPAPPVPVTAGSRIGVLTALANGDVCASVDVANLQQDFVIRLGLQDQPPNCSLEGATVTFRNSKGEVLMGSMVLRKGARETLRSFSPPIAPPPVVDLPGETVLTQSATPVPARSGTISPPDTGDGGLRPEP